MFSVILLGLVILVISSYQPILIGAGRFLAPTGMGKADVVILESTELIREDAVRIGLHLLNSGAADRLVMVYQYSENEKIFGRPLNYRGFLIQELEHLSLRKDQIAIFEVPKEHPITFPLCQ